MPFLLLMPSYNHGHYIAEAVNSVLAQDDPDWQLWIVDNSTDRTPEVMRQFDDGRIHYHHLPQRMDPGSCLNWMLARARGRDFSYIHTDNTLHPAFVRRMRAALSGEALSLAYCDMRVIDDSGRRTGVSRRGAFDLARLFSLGPLGVPFAATTGLAQALGGFSVEDVADDVRFCSLAWGMARFVYVREPLVDYRVHGQSRTEAFGGVDRLRHSFLRTHATVLPALVARGAEPLAAMGEAIAAGLDDLDWLVEDLWYRRCSRVRPWWPGEPHADALFQAGLLRLPGWRHAVPLPLAGRWGGRWHGPWTTAWLILQLRSLQPALRATRNRLRDLVLPWAWLTMRAAEGVPVSFRVADCGMRTLWAARLLQQGLGWQPHLDPSLRAPPWVPWPQAHAGLPLLDVRGLPSLV